MLPYFRHHVSTHSLGEQTGAGEGTAVAREAGGGTAEAHKHGDRHEAQGLGRHGATAGETLGAGTCTHKGTRRQRGGVGESVEEAAMALVEFDLKGQLHTEVVNACIVVTFAEEDEDGGKVNRPYVGIVVSCDPTEGMDVQFGADDALYTITNEDDWHWGDNITNKVPMM